MSLEEMQEVPHWLAELWFIGDLISTDLNDDFDALQRQVDRWEPAPMPGPLASITRKEER